MTLAVIYLHATQSQLLSVFAKHLEKLRQYLLCPQHCPCAVRVQTRRKRGPLLAQCLSGIFKLSFSGRQTVSIVFKISPRYPHT